MSDSIGIINDRRSFIIAHRIKNRCVADLFRFQVFEEDAADFVDRHRMHLHAVSGMDHQFAPAPVRHPVSPAKTP